MVADNGSARRDARRRVGLAWGFTIVEALVAILLLTVGGLALVSAAASLPAVLAQGRDDQRIAAIAVAEVERLRVHACLVGGSGERPVGGRRVVWTITAIGAGVLRLQVIVVSESSREVRVDTLTSAVVC